ncbi:MAG: class I SAM-dependent methyltransferase [Flavobacteriales bacterium]
MRPFLVRLLHPFLRRWYAWWSSKPRAFKADGLDMIVLPGVFHPGIFISTGLMAEHVAGLELSGRNFLELGAGAGRVALIAARKGASVTASDINPQAIENVKLNAERNGLKLAAVLSDLFAALPQHFDVIAINPPYYKYDAKSDAEKAFFAGNGHDYFVRLFPELAARMRKGTEVFIVLSGDLDRRPIDALAAQQRISFTEVRRKLFLGEAQVVFRSTLIE